MKALLVGVVAIVLVATSTTSASAATFHGYSQADELSYVNHDTGLSVTRPDRGVTQADNGCDSLFSGNAVYQTEWVLITSDAQNWIELGTGHQCSDTKRYWYWGYGYLGDWYPIGHEGNRTNGETHTFRVVRSNGSTWTWRVDGTAKDTLSWADQGARVRTGLESYAPSGVVSQYDQYSLQYTNNQGAWTSWAGYDAKYVSPTPTMCGGWNSASSWRSSENSSC